MDKTPEAADVKGPRRIWGLDPNVFFLGLVSLLTDVSSEMIVTLVPLFVTNVLGASATIVGLIGGLSDSTDAVFRGFSGWTSDRLGKRKLLAVLGYGGSSLVKPFMLLAGAWGAILGIRFVDRVGKGIRSAPRDALLASSLTKSERGRGFGIHRAMDTAGAVIGLAAAALIIYLTEGMTINLTLPSYRLLVIFGIVPAFAGVLVLAALVREKGGGDAPASKEAARPGAGSGRLDTRFKIFLSISVLFALGNYSDFFIILRAQNLSMPVVVIALMLVTNNVAYAALSVPSGVLSDKLGRRRVIALGWLVYALAYLGFALVGDVLWQIWALFILYGVYHAVFEGTSRAYVADLVPEGMRGTAYGLYQGLTGIALLPASLIAGWLWEGISPAAPFYYGAGLALVAMVGIMALVREK